MKRKEIDYKQLEHITEGKILDLVRKAFSKIKKILIKIPNTPIKGKLEKKQTTNLNLDYVMLSSSPAVKEFIEDFKEETFEDDLKNEKYMVKEIKNLTGTLADWIDTRIKNGEKINKSEIIDRFLPFYDLGNGDIGMLDKKTKKFVWFAHDDKRLIVDSKNNKIKI